MVERSSSTRRRVGTYTRVQHTLPRSVEKQVEEEAPRFGSYEEQLEIVWAVRAHIEAACIN